MIWFNGSSYPDVSGSSDLSEEIIVLDKTKGTAPTNFESHWQDDLRGPAPMKPGATIEIVIDGIGTLSNTFA